MNCHITTLQECGSSSQQAYNALYRIMVRDINMSQIKQYVKESKISIHWLIIKYNKHTVRTVNVLISTMNTEYTFA